MVLSCQAIAKSTGKLCRIHTKTTFCHIHAPVPVSDVEVVAQCPIDEWSVVDDKNIEKKLRLSCTESTQWKRTLRRIHPDKNPGCVDRATALTQRCNAIRDDRIIRDRHHFDDMYA